ncbi:hemerythrin domain-containing protein [Methylocystis sp. B8]|uniref:hemerythrin domain-containing protein n=1 Tax=Methylocystis sp. B8 TaxID=544938 RepID=UPI0010FEA24E|nr:hemerythrin domain-containing protein [Methylocystis sp. B8]TLG71823.1 hemerythrin domain-containing protein [Methylocystis sp. B8]
MPTATATTTRAKRAASRTNRKESLASAKPADAIKILKDDHREVKTWFKEFEKLEDDAEKEALARKICQALKLHAQIEEEIFYPALRNAIADGDLLDEAEVEHASAKRLIAEIQAMTPDDRLFDAKIKVLGEYVMHHVGEEENEIFPEARESGVDLLALGSSLAKRKKEMKVKMTAS